VRERSSANGEPVRVADRDRNLGSGDRVQPGALADPGHEHAAYHGRPVSWVAVAIIVAGFLCGGLSLVFTAWTTFWIGAGIVVVGALLAMATDMFEDWY
jgi:hypothetical protein